TPAAPPLRYTDGDQPFRRFPQIAAYDGQQIGIGRVVVDSTWHHWFDLNLKGIADAALRTGNRSDLDRILRYYVNVGIYLASPEWRRGMVHGPLKTAQLGYFGRQAIDLNASAFKLGRAAATFLQSETGSCWLTEGILEHLQSADGSLWPMLRDKLDEPRPARCRLDPQLVIDAVLGEIVRALYSDMDDLRDQVATYGQVCSSPLFERLGDAAVQGARHGLETALVSHAADLENGKAELESFLRERGLAALN
ncbi:MAG: hypothetical protein ACJ8DZ_12390, partial [Allosphingosinicella sp.]